jgi:FdhD protein
VCGRRSIDALASACAPLDSIDEVPVDVIVSLPSRLRAHQSVFDRTGGLHAAGLFTLEGTLLDCAEDVGRHNAVDKVIGRLVLREALPASNTVLCVSGRTSFEIVQKAWMAGIGCVASVSAPSSLAIDLAAAARITLIGFVRDGSYNVYTTGRS